MQQGLKLSYMYHIHSNSHPCPYKRPPVIFWGYKPSTIYPDLFTKLTHIPVLSLYDWELAWKVKMAKVINLWVEPCNKYWKNKRPPEMTKHPGRFNGMNLVQIVQIQGCKFSFWFLHLILTAFSGLTLLFLIFILMLTLLQDSYSDSHSFSF